MRFGLFYELQLPKPWVGDAEHRLIREAIDQVVLADRIGIDYAWATEHHFLEEYAHSSASEVLLTALAAKTERIRVGFGIRQVIPHYNHPARTAEAVSMLDLISGGRVDFGIGESATAMELDGFNVPVADVNGQLDRPVGGRGCAPGMAVWLAQGRPSDSPVGWV